MRSLAVAAFALAAVASLASAVQDPYAGKSAAELIECRLHIGRGT